jgi:GNAT superfamily N-acetyltransferase
MRPLAGPEELDLFCRVPYLLNAELGEDLASGRRRPEWMWVALRGDQLVARLAWWGRKDGNAPQVLDVFDVGDAPERVEMGARLLRVATEQVIPNGAGQPEYSRFVSPGWRDDVVAREAVEDRMTALAQTGAHLLVERLRLEWRPPTPVGSSRVRLSFRPANDGDELVDLMTQVLDGTLDAHSLDQLTRVSAKQAVGEHYENEFLKYKSPRDWWRIATLPAGGPVGFVIPARNDYNAIIAYVGVLPEHRGHRYIDEILAEGTSILAAQGVPRIRAATDLDNVPMARAFQRAGYVNFERQINMTWS